MFFGVVVNRYCAALSITEIRPIETRRPLTRLFRVNRNSVWSATSPAKAAIATASATETGKRKHREVGEIPGRIGSDHHELPEGKVHDADDAERHGDAERDNSIERTQNDAIEDLPDNDLRHAYGTTCVTSLTPPFFRSTISKSNTCSLWLVEADLPHAVIGHAKQRGADFLDVVNGCRPSASLRPACRRGRSRTTNTMAPGRRGNRACRTLYTPR